MKLLPNESLSVLLALSLIFAGKAWAQSQPPAPSATPIVFSNATLNELKQLQQAALTSDYAYKQVAHLANNIGPRLSGSAQAQKAVEYVSEEMKTLGGQVQLEKVMVPHWVRGEETAALVEFPGQAKDTTQKIVLTALGSSVATPADGITAEVVVVKDFDELQALGKEKVSGKIVLFNHAFDKEMAAEGHGGEAYGEAVVYRSIGASAAARLGALASLIRSVGGADFRLPHTGSNNYAADAPKIPAAAVTAEDADLMAYLVAQGSVKMHLVLTPQQLPDAESANVIADFKGSEHPDEVVIVSGHLDSWDLGTGAIDDAAGVAVSMETANLLQRLHLHPHRTIRVIAWMNEENGLRGGKAYAKDHAGEIAKQYAAIETDLGADHPLGINVKARSGAAALFAPVGKILEESGAGLINQVQHSGSDLDDLGAAGVPCFSPIQGSRNYFKYHHSAADTLDKIAPRELAATSAVVAVTAYALANMETPLPR